MKIQIGDEVREMTEDEKANYDMVKRHAEAQVAAIEAAAAAKVSAQAKLAALGLTEDEVKAIIGGV